MDYDTLRDEALDEYVSQTEQEHDAFDLIGEEATGDNSIAE